MLSILIPVYQHDCTRLVTELHAQATECGVPFEIVLAEDGSEPMADYTALNLPQLRHILRKNNVGRAAIRNYLFTEAKYPWVLMLDCDVTLPDNLFVKRYLDETHANLPCCICGGNRFPEQLPPEGYRLRYTYEKHLEKKYTTYYLNSDPHAPFWTSAFFIHRDLLTKKNVYFDERYKGYGYEDVQFGKDLRKANILIYYINNPILCEDLIDDETYLKKIDESLRTLLRFRTELQSESSLLQALDNLHYHPLLKFIVKHLSLRRFLPNYYAFQYYRLRHLLQLENFKTQ